MKLEDRLWRFRRRRADYRAALLATPAGRRVLADLRRFCLIDAPLEGATSERTHVQLGQRNVFLHVRRCLDAEPESLEQLTRTADDE
ncbi:MAG: hypothetical protein ACKVSF_11165 [Alphaproteobacteria bacterium]